MIEKLGVGIDLVDCTQFQKISYPSKPGFYKKIFLSSEIKYCLKYKNPHIHFGGKFAIKEAVKKSLELNIPMLHIVTSHSASKPIVSLTGKLQKQYAFQVSLSHENDMAVAVVISEKY